MLTNVAWLRPLELATARKLTTALVQNGDGSDGGTIRFFKPGSAGER